MKRILRLVGATGFTLALALLAGCSSDASPGAGQESGTSAPQSQASAAAQSEVLVAPPASEQPVAVSATDPLVFEGEGNSLTSRFDILDGVLYLEAEHMGGSGFSVRILTDRHLESQSKTGGLHSGTGSPRGNVLTIDSSGAYRGARAHQVSPAQLFGLTPGTYLMQIAADGAWKVELTQPQWDIGESPPFNWSGDGDDVKGPMKLDTGTAAVKVTHGGSSNFVVELITSDGKTFEKLVNVVGAYDGAVDVKIHPMIGLTPDIYGLVITADGDWTVDFGN